MDVDMRRLRRRPRRGPDGPVRELADVDGTHGGKAVNLRWLIEHGYPVPSGVAIPPDAPAELVRAQLQAFLRPGDTYAVRSSASVEDSAAWSFAGQFATVLGVRGLDAVTSAVADVRDSAHNERVRSYLSQAGIDAADIRMGVIVQHQVPARSSGVAFSRNPLTGLGETVIEAVSGTAEALVSGEVSPHRWILRWGEWTARPEASELPEPVARELAELVGRVARQRSEPVDIEWAWDGGQLWLLQVRPMTRGEVPVYSNRISREFLPGMITPLVWSVNVPVVNGAWLRLFESLVGDLPLQPEDLARQFAYRAYFNMQAVGDVFEALGMPRDLLEVLMGLPGGDERPAFRPDASVARHLPRMAAMAWRLLNYTDELARTMPALQRQILQMEERDPAALSDAELASAFDAVADLAEDLATANIVTPLLLNAYSAMLRRQLEHDGLDPHSVDLAAVDPASALLLRGYDPTPHLARLAESARTLGAADQERLHGGDLAALPGAAQFLDRFGHFSDSGNDFASVPWREDPSQLAPVLLGDTASAPASEGASEDAAETPVPSSARRAAARAARMRLERERVSYTYTRGYGLFRPLALEAGGRLVARGVLADAGEAFLLTRSELFDALAGDADPGTVADTVARRRREMDDLKDVVMPEVIYGDDFEPAAAAPAARTLHGLPTSRGTHHAVARVARGMSEAGRVERGDVVVIPYSDVGWTPMLARAGAIVAEAGGMLSHSSILARELGIPCVVSVDRAMQIPDGSLVRVDGYSGEVTWE